MGICETFLKLIDGLHGSTPEHGLTGLLPDYNRLSQAEIDARAYQALGQDNPVLVTALHNTGFPFTTAHLTYAEEHGKTHAAAILKERLTSPS